MIEAWREDGTATRAVVTIPAGEIAAGDWMRDRGEMKEVAEVEAVLERLALLMQPSRAAGPSAYIVKFSGVSTTGEAHLYVPADVCVSVWRRRPEPSGSAERAGVTLA